MISPAPSSDEQVLFLRNVQRLLAEGQFTASYKFALLRALADLAVLHGDDTGAPLDLDTRAIAVRFVELYWRQCRPFPTGADAPLVLRQNTGKQAAIVAVIAGAQQRAGMSLFRFRQGAPDHWSALVSDVDGVVRDMPLLRLQTVGEERLDFLYENLDRGGLITLKPGVAYCLRAFYGLIRDLIEGAWVRFVQRVNANRLGGATDLGAFLFGEERAGLETYRAILLDVQGGTCFYCRRDLRGSSQVDHFIPWSRYPADLGHNFVLAHERCNGAKSDHLAAEDHLRAWVERNRLNDEELRARLREAELPCDLAATNQVARWVYRQTERANGQVWVADKMLRHLGPDWARCFAA